VTADVLVIGAGPAGLALALQAHDHGASVRIIDRRPDPGRPSRALIMHARTLEVLRPLGVTQALLAVADVGPVADVRLGTRTVRMCLGDLPLPGTPYPHLTLIRQSDVEDVLARALADRGVTVEHGTELVGLHERADSVRAVLRSGAATTNDVSRFAVGCDGPASTVRAHARIGWPGGSYPVEIVLADVELDPDIRPGAVHVMAGSRGLLFLFPCGEQATWRLLATRPVAQGPDRPLFGQLGPPVTSEELAVLADDAGLESEIASVAWSARVRVQHRVAERFSRGRLYLAGDAAHAYSPATGQGMNAAIQDAANLGWKLAFASAHQPSQALLDSYDIERRAAARHVLAMTSLAFWFEAATGPVASALRGCLAPLIVPTLARKVPGRRRLAAAGLRLVSQLAVSYRRSPLSADFVSRRGSRLRAGDRLPDQTVMKGKHSMRLHDLLAKPGVHVLFDRDVGLAQASLGPFVHVHELTDMPGLGLMAVRPDGHVGLHCRADDVRQLSAWLTDVGAVGVTPPSNWVVAAPRPESRRQPVLWFGQQ
jgi:2-polyprenyl-6-methoxyphenol hydroxylase-like FAD-dependent oxidoreductase